MYRINKIAFTITTIIFMLVIFIYSISVNWVIEKKIITFSKSNDNSIAIMRAVEKTNKEIKQTKKKAKSKEWRLKIDSINLDAPIAEGTDSETLNKYIGHFENTKKIKGNIGLAAHNRGYEVNYFKSIKNLEKGDIIKYFYNGKEYKYEVYKNHIISDTNWDVLESNSKNEITLITCVENRPTVRRCIKGKRIDKYDERNVK